MPWLNWKKEAITLKRSTTARGHERLELAVPPALLNRFSEMLRPALELGATELRVDLPEGWSLFWKARDTETKLLVAHPESDQWVATLAIQRGTGGGLLESLEVLEKEPTASPLELTQVAVQPGGSLHRVSNFELMIARAN